MDFLQQKQKQKKMIVILIILVLITIMILFSKNLFEKNNSQKYIFNEIGTKKININWDVLNDPKLKELEIY